METAHARYGDAAPRNPEIRDIKQIILIGIEVGRSWCVRSLRGV
jgi:hypothetical protein